MTPDQLRALADALDGCTPYRDSASVYQAAAYLRACADAQPVAWIKTTHAGVRRLEWNEQTHYSNNDYPATTEPLYLRVMP